MNVVYNTGRVKIGARYEGPKVRLNADEELIQRVLLEDTPDQTGLFDILWGMVVFVGTVLICLIWL